MKRYTKSCIRSIANKNKRKKKENKTSFFYLAKN